MKFFVYCLYSEKFDRIYIGQTQDLKKRILQHETGKVKSTKAYRPYIIIYSEQVCDRAIALKREKQLKTSAGRKYLRAFIR